jgi:hypothetical protein
MATGSRAQMLAMPVPTTIRRVAASNRPALVRASRPNTSQGQRELQPSSSSSATTALTRSVGWLSR